MAELALDHSLEASPDLSEVELLLVEEQVEKRFSCVAMLDNSFSMAGEKHLLSSIAVAVLLLELPPEDASIVAFGSQAKTIKALGSRASAPMTITNFLAYEPRGYTNIGAGLKVGLDELQANRRQKRSVGILITDGRVTEGEDPFDKAALFDSLVVLHLHGSASHLETSEGLAKRGNGMCLEVEQMQDLPGRLYEAIRQISRR